MAKRVTAHWTDDDLARLRGMYGSLPNRDLARFLNKSKQSIQHMAMRVGLTTRKIATGKWCCDCSAKLSRAAIYKATAKRCRSCADKRHVGERHHNWHGGVASLRSIVHVMLKPVWIDPILRAANYTCRFCDTVGGDMNVHHTYPYRLIRDEVLRAHPELSRYSFEGKKALALKIVEAHKLSYGIALCVSCHANVHSETRGELLENLTATGEGNQQPSRPNVLQYVGRKVHRLTGEDTQSNKPDTSAPHPVLEGDDIVGTCGKPQEAGHKQALR